MDESFVAYDISLNSRETGAFPFSFFLRQAFVNTSLIGAKITFVYILKSVSIIFYFDMNMNLSGTTVKTH